MTPHEPHHAKRNTASLIQHIRSTRKERTILFTDIEHSTRFWSRHGDIQGRLMVDRHNWLLFPVIRHFGGWVVKTIGDSIMAAFKDPDQALRAAIAFQQMLERERRLNPDFTIQIRIGLHSGATLVEHNDVFGDVVNTAARVESQAEGGEILLSAETRKRINWKKYVLEDHGAFVPKGKTRPLQVYLCRWQEAPDLLEPIRVSSRLPLIPGQRLEILLYAASSAAAVLLPGWLYLRFLASENETLSLMLLNPGTFWWEYPLLILLGVLAAAGLYAAAFKLKKIPHALLRCFKGGFGFLAAFTLSLGLLSLLPGAPGRYFQTPLHASKHLFVKALLPDTPAYRTPALDGEIFRHFQPGQLLLLNAVKQSGGVTWNRVLVGPGRYGWMPRVLPLDIGVLPKRVTFTDKFYFRIRDLYALILGLCGFLWGFLTFRLRPA